MDPAAGTDATSRSDFMRAMGGGAAAVALAAVVAACGDERTTGNQFGGAGVGTEQYGQGDAGIVAYALFLERLETAFYEGAVRSGKLSGRALALFERFGREEAAHVKSLQGALQQLRGKEPPVPKFAFEYQNQDQIVRAAAHLVTVGAGAYLGQVRRSQNKRVLAAAQSIHSVAARHAAALAQFRGENVTPDGAFANPSASSDVLRQVTPYLTT